MYTDCSRGRVKHTGDFSFPLAATCSATMASCRITGGRVRGATVAPHAATLQWRAKLYSLFVNARPNICLNNYSVNIEKGWTVTVTMIMISFQRIYSSSPPESPDRWMPKPAYTFAIGGNKLRMTMIIVIFGQSRRGEKKTKKKTGWGKTKRWADHMGCWGRRLHSCHLCRAFSRSVTFTHETRAHEPNNRINSKQLVDLMRHLFVLLSTRKTKNRLSPRDGKMTTGELKLLEKRRITLTWFRGYFGVDCRVDPIQFCVLFELRAKKRTLWFVKHDNPFVVVWESRKTRVALKNEDALDALVARL